MDDTEFAPAARLSAEQIRAEAQRFLSQEPLLRRILDTTPMLVLVLNPQRQLVYGNRRLEELTGEELEQLIGQRPGELLGCEHAEENLPGGCGTTKFCANCGAVRAILSSLEGQADVQECRLTRTDGKALDLRVWTAPLELHGERYGLFLAQDISAEKRRAALERVFFHDVLNTAGAALGWATLDESLPETAPQARTRLPVLIRRLIDEINTHRDLAEIESGHFQVQIARVRAGALLQSLAQDWAEEPCAKGKVLELAEDSADPTLVTDATLLRRVLSNMIKNALEASGTGERVLVRCEEHGARVRFSVNNPAVMPREVQMQLFQRSFSTKGTGRGLGTYSMRLLSERFLQGTVTFSSKEGAGTTFIASFPREIKPG